MSSGTCGFKSSLYLHLTLTYMFLYNCVQLAFGFAFAWKIKSLQRYASYIAYYWPLSGYKESNKWFYFRVQVTKKTLEHDKDTP